MALITQAELEQFTQVDFTADPDTAVTLWLDAATQAIETAVGRPLTYETGIVEKVDAVYAPTITVERTPVEAVASVVADGTPLVEGDDFVWYRDGRIVRVLNGWPRPWGTKRQSVVVTYDGGYGGPTPVPYDLRLACALVAFDLFSRQAEWVAAPTGVKSVGLEAESVTYHDPARVDAAARLLGDPAVRRLIAPYVRRLP